MTKNKIHSETIKLYEQLVYHKEEEFGGLVDNTNEEIWHPKGWYYHGTSFTSLITNFHNNEFTQIFQEIAVNIDLQKVKELQYIRNILEDLNSEQLNNLNKEIKYWQDELVRLPAPITIIENQIIYYTNAFYRMNEWFSLTTKKEIILRTEIHKKNYLIENKSDSHSIAHNQIDPPSSKIDAEKVLINNCIRYINSEIDKLGKEYKKGKVVEICNTAYEKIIPNNKTKKSVSVTDFSKAIYPRIKHRFSDWKELAFFNYLSQNTSPKVKK